MKVFFAFVLISIATAAPAQLAPDAEAKVAAITTKVLHDTGVPSASVGIVQNGRVVYAQAFGMARITPELPATADMAYPVGSISKQFTATAVLLLQEKGKISIDDPVGKYFPELTRAADVKLRNLMTMTSGYEDFAPQDYSIPAWYQKRDPADTVKEWAGKPLDFEPGAQWQYSNTNYVLLARIVEKVTGEPFYQFLRVHVLDPAGLTDAFNAYTDRDKLKTTGYISYAMQKPRVLPLEAPGWYFGDGELAMPASTLLKWDLTIINRAILKPESYKQFETSFVATGGADTGYGLGVGVHVRNGRLPGRQARDRRAYERGGVGRCREDWRGVDGTAAARGNNSRDGARPGGRSVAGHSGALCEGTDRPHAVLGELQFVLQRKRDRGLQGCSQASGRGDVGVSHERGPSRGDDVRRVPCGVRKGDHAGAGHVLAQGRQDRTIADYREGLADCALLEWTV